MACVNVPGHAMAPISRLMARVWGNSGDTHPAAMYDDPKAGLAKTNTQSWNDKALQSKVPAEEKRCVEKTPPALPKRERELRIDSTTQVPAELYWSLLRAGDRAKNRGQHHFQEAPRHAVGFREESPKPRLVRS